MVRMDEKRINEWKCSFCGSKQKKIIQLFNDSGTEVGYSLHCCNCGNINTFALHGDAISAAIGYMNKISKRKIICGYSEKVKNCSFIDCPFRPDTAKREQMEKNASSISGDIREAEFIEEIAKQETMIEDNSSINKLPIHFK